MTNIKETGITPEFLYNRAPVPSPVNWYYTVEKFRRDCMTGNLPEDIIHEISAGVYYVIYYGFYKDWNRILGMVKAINPEKYEIMAGWSEEEEKMEVERLALTISSEFGFIEDGKPSEKCLALARIILADQHPE